MPISDEVWVKLLTDVKDSITSMAKYTAAIGAAYLAVTRIVRAVGSMVNAYSKQEIAETKLAAALKSTGYAVGISAMEMKDMAKALQAITTYGDEVVIEAEALLVTFTKIGRDVFPRALEAAMDMSQMFGQDLQQSVIQLGTALNDPIQGVGRLRRIGISFTQDQKDLIASLVEENKIMDAQKVILDELAVEFGGVARAAGETATGSLEKFKNAMGDLTEATGETILKGTSPLLDTLTDIVSEIANVRKEANKLDEAMKNVELVGSIEDLREQYDVLQKQIDLFSNLSEQEKAFMREQQSARLASDEYIMSLITQKAKISDQIAVLEKELKALQNASGAVDDLKDDTENLTEEIDWQIEHLDELNEALHVYVIWEQQLNSTNSAIENINENMAEMIEKMKEQQEEAEAMGEKMATAISPFTDAFGAALLDAEQGWENFKEAAKNAIAGVLEMLAKQAFAQAVIEFARLNFAVGAALSAAGVAALVAAGVVKAMKEGGIVTSPTLALLGEAGPEMVTPLGKAVGQTVVIHNSIQGSVITQDQLAMITARTIRRAARGY